MKAIHRRRLRKLADFLAGPVHRADLRERRLHGRKKFTMGAWSCYNNAADIRKNDWLDPSEIGLTPNLCNTAGCALGWATVAFPRSLKLEDGGVYLCDDPNGDPGTFFGLDNDQFDTLFLSGWKMNARQKAAQIRKVADEA